MAPLLRADERLTPPPPPITLPLEKSQVAPEVNESWRKLLQGAGGGEGWQAYVDQRTARIDAAVGSGIPWIPGSGNKLSGQEKPGVSRCSRRSPANF